MKVSGSRYQQVALDIAAKIANGDYQIGQKIYARSSLASQYAVSPETARRAIAILADLGIVDVTKGSGVVIKSEENAKKFITQFHGAQTITGYQREVVSMINQLTKDGETLRASVSRLVEYASYFRNSNPFVPFELTVSEDSPCIGLSLQELNFWQNTGATVVAIRHKNELILSPGPYADLNPGDIIFFIGAESCVDRVSKLLQDETPLRKLARINEIKKESI